MIGKIAVVLSSAALVPQVIKVVLTGETHGLSLWFYLLLAAASACWLAYGMQLRDKPVVTSGAIQIGLVTAIVLFKVTNILRGWDPLFAL